MSKRVIKTSQDARAALVIEDDAIHLRVGSNFVTVNDKGIVESGKKASLQGSNDHSKGGLTKGVMDLTNLLPSFGPVMPLKQRDINLPVMPLLALVQTVGQTVAIGIVMAAAMSGASAAINKG